MSFRLNLPVWSCLVAIVLASGPLVRADAPPPAVPDGYKEVKLPSGSSILVKEESDPFKHISGHPAPDKYDPTLLFNHESSLAHKEFSTSTGPFSQKDSDPHDQSAYLTKAYAEMPPPDLAKSEYSTSYPLNANADAHATSDFTRTYPTSTASIARGSSRFITTTSPDQDRTALLTDHKPEVHSYVDAGKQYLGPGAQKVPEGIEVKENVVIARLGDIPNRPLTVDEVRDLINHGVKADTDAPPEAGSHALNDPDYKPEPLRDIPPPPPPGESDDKDAPVPSPGTIANPPENAEPLPQH